MGVYRPLISSTETGHRCHGLRFLKSRRREPLSPASLQGRTQVLSSGVSAKGRTWLPSSLISIEHRARRPGTWALGSPVSTRHQKRLLSCRLYLPALSPWTGTESPTGSGLTFLRCHRTRDSASPRPPPPIPKRAGGRRRDTHRQHGSSSRQSHGRSGANNG